MRRGCQRNPAPPPSSPWRNPIPASNSNTCRARGEKKRYEQVPALRSHYPTSPESHTYTTLKSTASWGATTCLLAPQSEKGCEWLAGARGTLRRVLPHPFLFPPRPDLPWGRAPFHLPPTPSPPYPPISPYTRWHNPSPTGISRTLFPHFRRSTAVRTPMHPYPHPTMCGWVFFLLQRLYGGSGEGLTLERKDNCER